MSARDSRRFPPDRDFRGSSPFRQVEEATAFSAATRKEAAVEAMDAPPLQVDPNRAHPVPRVAAAVEMAAPEVETAAAVGKEACLNLAAKTWESEGARRK